MDFLEITMSWAMALDYLRERARERKNKPEILHRLSILHLSAQLLGRTLMTSSVYLHLAGKRLVILGQQSTS